MLQQLSQHIRLFWRSLVLVTVPAVCSPLILYPGAGSPQQCGYVMLVTALFWVTEALPLAITSLIPLVLLPMFGIMSTDHVGKEYFRETTLMFMASMMMAMAIEECQLHKRIALAVLAMVGSTPRRLLLGFMLPTMFLSMWISSTACTAMMIPIAQAVLAELSAPDSSSTAKMILISIAYAANCGGSATLTGTGPNLVLKELLSSAFGDQTPINYASWMGYAVPPVLLNVLLCWLWLQIFFLGWRPTFGSQRSTHQDANGQLKTAIRQQLNALGPLTLHEGLVCLLFLLLIVLWLLREPPFISGWADWFTLEHLEYEATQDGCHTNCTYVVRVVKKRCVDDASAGMAVVLLLFMLPRRLAFWPFAAGRPHASPGLLTWPNIHEKMPWSLVFLLGGGFALSKAAQVSGLSALLGAQLQHLQLLPTWCVVILVMTGTAILTEFTSNVATCSILLPVVKDLATALRMNPLYLLVPVTLSSCFAFMLPVASPSNAIVYSAAAGRLGTWQMMQVGLGMNLIAIAVNFAWLQSFGLYYLDLGTWPSWAVSPHNTSS